MSILSKLHQSSVIRRGTCFFMVVILMSCSTTTKNPNDPKNKDPLKDKYPFLTKPEVRTIWIDDTIDGNKFIEGHRVYILEKSSGWTK